MIVNDKKLNFSGFLSPLKIIVKLLGRKNERRPFNKEQQFQCFLATNVAYWLGPRNSKYEVPFSAANTPL